MAIQIAGITLAQLEQRLHTFIQSVDTETLLTYGSYGLTVYCGVFAARTLSVAVGRTFGVYHPNHYYWWPHLPWRWPYKHIWLWLKDRYESICVIGKRPTGGFGSLWEVCAQRYKPGMLFLGRAYGCGFPLLQPIGDHIERHCFLFSMSGGGKTTLLISQINCWKGSCFILDPKGQITRALYLHDTRTWYIFSPQKKFGFNSASINVFDLFDILYTEEGEGAFVDCVQYICKELIPTPEDAKSPYFYKTPCGFLVGIIIHVYTAHEGECWHLPLVRDLMKYGYQVFVEKTGQEKTSADEDFALLLRA